MNIICKIFGHKVYYDRCERYNCSYTIDPRHKTNYENLIHNERIYKEKQRELDRLKNIVDEYKKLTKKEFLSILKHDE